MTNEEVELCKQFKAFLPYLEKFINATIEFGNSKNRYKKKNIIQMEMFNTEFRQQARKYNFLPTLKEELKYDNISIQEFKKLTKEIHIHD